MTLTEASAADAEPRPAVPEPLLTPQPAPSGTKRTPTLRRMFVLGAGVTALLMLVAIVSGAIALGRLSAARTVLLDEVGPAARANQDLARAFLNQETGIRGFALSGDPTTLVPYRDGRTEEARAIEVLRGYLAQRPATAAPVDAVERAAAAWRTDYAEPVVTAGGGPGAPDPAVGKDLFDALRAPMAELTAVVDVERLAAREQLNDSADALRWVGLAIAAVMVLFLVAAAWGLRRGVLDPLSALAAQVRDLVTGDVRREVHAGGPREVVELGTDIEAMRRVISSEVDSLHDVNRLLDEQARDLERSNRDLEQFAYVASHDLQEPLRKVSSFCQLLQRRYGGQLDERADQYIEFAVDGAQRMQRLINDLLAFSRVGRTTSDFEPVDLREIGLAAAAQLDATRTELDGEIIIGELPQVQGDPALLRQLLLNLFGNGLKFHRPDTAPVVRADAQRTDDGWEISVVDNGIGIDPEYAEKVFVIFQRLHGRESYEGTGIGLALAKRIVEFHGGRIWLDTTPRQQPGTAIRFTLPFDVPAPGPAPTPQEQQ